MKLFLRKTVLVFLILTVLLVVVTIINWAYITNSNYFILNKNINVLVLGDSHAKYALDDKILKNTCNLSTDADSYFYSYLKLKELNKKNIQIDTLLLSFSQHNISKSIETMWLFNSEHLKNRLKFYYPLFEMEDILFMLQKKPVDFLSNLFSQVLNPYYFAKNGRNNYGGYVDLEHNILEQEIAKYEKNKEHQEEFIESQIEKSYLEKIKLYCNKNNVKLILISSPLHKTVNRNQENLYGFYEKYFADVTFIDYSQLELPDSYFGDLVHLSPKGSAYFSHLINKNGIVGIKVSDVHTNSGQNHLFGFKGKE